MWECHARLGFSTVIIVNRPPNGFVNHCCPFGKLRFYGQLDWDSGMNWKVGTAVLFVNLDGVMSIALSQCRDGTYQTVSSPGVCHPKSREGEEWAVKAESAEYGRTPNSLPAFAAPSSHQSMLCRLGLGDQHKSAAALPPHGARACEGVRASHEPSPTG